MWNPDHKFRIADPCETCPTGQILREYFKADNTEKKN